MVRRYALGAAAGTALVVSLTGCLGDSGSKTAATNMSAAQAITLASQKTATVSSFSGTLTGNGSALGQKYRLTGTYYDQLKPTEATRVDITEAGAAGMSVGGVQQVRIGDEMYLKVPALTRLTGGKPWVKFSISQLAAKGGVQVGRQQADPQTLVTMLTASKDVHKVGTTGIDGVSTTHYRGTYTMRQALAKLDSKQRQQAENALNQQGLDKVNFDVWVDGRQLPRKVTMTSPSGSKAQFKLTMTFGDFNKKVNVTAPPADQVADGSNLNFGGKLPG